MKRRDLTAEERALWRQAMRNTMPLPGREADDSGEEENPGTPVPALGESPPVEFPESAAQPPAANPAAQTGGLDAAAQRRLRRGRIVVDGRVDLHGMRQSEAHAALSRYLAESQAAGRRCVLVITGKGGRQADHDEAGFMFRDGDGVLRRQAPIWLSQEPNASRIFAVEPAHPRHGGAGAFYVFLRRVRGDRS